MPKPSELDLDILALDPRSSDTKISTFIEISKNDVKNSYFFKIYAVLKQTAR